jgi:hypothetical protein
MMIAFMTPVLRRGRRGDKNDRDLWIVVIACALTVLIAMVTAFLT